MHVPEPGEVLRITQPNLPKGKVVPLNKLDQYPTEIYVVVVVSTHVDSRNNQWFRYRNLATDGRGSMNLTAILKPDRHYTIKRLGRLQALNGPSAQR